MIRRLLTLVLTLLSAAYAQATETVHQLLVEGLYAEALVKAQEGIQNNDPLAHYYLGLMYRNEWGVKPSPALTVEHLQTAYDAGILAAGYQLGVMYYHGDFLSKDFDKAASYLERTAVAADIDKRWRSDSSLYMAWIREQQNNPLAAFKWLQRGSHRYDGSYHHPATWTLGYFYLQGIGVEQNQTEADRLFTIAFDTEKTLDIGTLADERIDKLSLRLRIDKDVTLCEAIDLLASQLKEIDYTASYQSDGARQFCFDVRRAEDPDHGDSAKRLAENYLDGVFVEHDVSQALRYAKLAVKAGALNADQLVSEIVLRDFVYGNDMRAFKMLEGRITGECSKDIECAFDTVWSFLDVSKDSQLSLAEISRFQRLIVKLALVEKATGRPDLAELSAATGSSLLLSPVVSTAIINSFDYNADGFLAPSEVLGDSEFSELVGINAKTLSDGFDLEGLQYKLRKNFGSGIMGLLK